MAVSRALGLRGVGIAGSRGVVAATLACAVISTAILIAGTRLASAPAPAVTPPLAVRGPLSVPAHSGTVAVPAALPEGAAAPAVSAVSAARAAFILVVPSRPVVVEPSDSSPDQETTSTSGD